MKALSTKIKLPLAEIDESEEENLENLIRNNKKINNDIKNQRAHSDSLWAAVTGGGLCSRANADVGGNCHLFTNGPIFSVPTPASRYWSMHTST